MKSILICLVSALFLGGSSSIDNMLEYTGIAVNKSNSQEQILETAKVSWSKTESTKTTYTMKVKGASSTTKLKKGNSYEFYVRYTPKENGTLFLVKFDVDKDKRVIESVEAIINPEKNNKPTKFIQMTSEYYNREKIILKVTPSESLAPGSYGILGGVSNGTSMTYLNSFQNMLFDIVE